ncbi:ABC transporter ATP-binding protein [Carnobacterium pleistocenium]|uniref:ABC transporter ATP-binding protein n=1 Tax=Carnobacterium pleistocenium TaxID=181073 RepID=UPI00054E9704|nr:ABC transporter ATP-binding protein [Carnobacterium pleistocenium]
MSHMKDSLRRIWQYIKPYKISFLSAIALTVVCMIVNALQPYIIGLAVTELGKNVADMLNNVPNAGVNFSYLRTIVAISLAMAGIYQITLYLSSYIMTNVVQNTMRDLRNKIEEKINRLPVSYFDRNQQGNILSRVTNDVDSISNAMQQSLIQMANSFMGIVFAVTMMFYLSVPLALVIIFTIPLSFMISKAIIKKSQPYFKGQQESLGAMNGHVQESFSGFTEIKLYGKERDKLEEFKEINANLTDHGFKAAFISGTMNPLVGFVSNLAYFGVAVGGGFLVIAGSLSLGNLQAFTQYIWQVNQPISQITQLSGVIQSAAAAIDRVFEILDEPEELLNKTEYPLPATVEGYVTFEQVSFGYDREKPLITDLNVSVKKGQTVAVVGPTGAGKTTLINLLMRFYDVDKGTIKIDGIDTKSMSRQDVRSLFGMVLQDAWVYSGTIAENIRFGKLDATDEEVIEAAKTANVDHFIRTLPEGYNMKLNKEASNVSLGQKQLLTIARAIISDPKILILDEATSSVDTRLESLIQKAMKKVMEGRTSFVIAHRLSTIRDSDLILVMDQGQIIEQGTHEELLEKGAFYEKLYNSQFSEEE